MLGNLSRHLVFVVLSSVDRQQWTDKRHDGFWLFWLLRLEVSQNYLPPHPCSTTVFRNIYQECHPQNKIKLYVFCPIMLRWCNVMNFLMKILSGPTIFYLADFCCFFSVLHFVKIIFLLWSSPKYVLKWWCKGRFYLF